MIVLRVEVDDDVLLLVEIVEQSLDRGPAL
jgi:hypothetical protein